MIKIFEEKICKAYVNPNPNKKEMPICPFTVKSVIFNDPATIVFWKDGTKTVVKCVNEKWDAEKALAMAFMKKSLGNNYHYYDTVQKWLKKDKASAHNPKHSPDYNMIGVNHP